VASPRFIQDNMPSPRSVAIGLVIIVLAGLIAMLRRSRAA